MAAVLPRLRRICLAPPGTEETENFGDPFFRFKRKPFCVFHGPGDAHTIAIHVAKTEQGIFLQDLRFIKTPYIGQHGWMVRDPDTCAVVRNIMAEAEAVAGKLEMEVPVSIDQRIAGAEKVGEHKTSMLQDLEAGRAMKLEAIVGAVVELGECLDVPMPHTRSVYACTKLLDRVSRGA